MSNTVIVLGGSFNPPTIAHKQILETVVRNTRARLGLFVPSSDTYVCRKMSRLHGIVFTERERYEMCNALTLEMDTPAAVSTLEYGDDGRGHTYDTLCRVQEQYPDARICLIVGEDKLGIIPKWHDAEKLLGRFMLIVTKRSNDSTDIYAKIDADPLLRRYAGNMTVVELEDDMAEISSTKARGYIKSGRLDKSRELTDSVKQLVKTYSSRRVL